MRNYIGSVCLAALVTGALLAAVQPVAAQEGQRPRIVVMDGDRVTTETRIGQRVHERINSAAESWQQRLNAAQLELNQLVQQRQQQQLTLSAEALSRLNNEIEEKQVALERLRDDARRAMERLQQEGIDEVNAILIPALEAMAAEEGYDLVFDARLTQTGGLLFYADAIDVTDGFIARVNAATPRQ